MTATLFLGFVAVVAAGILIAGRRYLAAAEARWLTIALPLWLLYVGVMGALGVVRGQPSGPPGILVLLLPMIAFVGLVLLRSDAAGRAARALPLGLLIGAQVFRVGVELFLHQLWREGLAPQMLTYEGANVDIWVGVSAPTVAWLAMRRPGARGFLLAWNGVGLLALLNIVTRALLTAPGPLNLLHTEVPNRFIATFPYMFVPGLMVLLAVTLHVLAIRHLRAAPEHGVA